MKKVVLGYLQTFLGLRSCHARLLNQLPETSVVHVVYVTCQNTMWCNEKQFNVELIVYMYVLAGYPALHGFPINYAPIPHVTQYITMHRNTEWHGFTQWLIQRPVH